MKTAIKIKPEKYTFRRSVPIYLMLLPGLAYLIINNYLPMAGIVVAFKKLNFKLGIFGSPWNGLDNLKGGCRSSPLSPYRFTLQLSRRRTAPDYICYNLAFIVLGTIIPITVAILLNEIRSKAMARVYQTSILLPYLMSYVVVSYLAYAFLSVDTGFINKVLIPLFGREKAVLFYQEKKYWPFILTFVHLWKGLGFSTVVYLASIVGISPELYEAARMDGASKWQQIRNVTLPNLVPTAITLFILSVGKIFFSDFGLFYQVPRNSGMLFSATQTIDTYVYNALMVNNNIALSSAASVLQSLCGVVCILLANWVVRKISEENAMF